MSQGGALYSTADLQRSEFVSLVREVGDRLQAQVIDFRDQEGSDARTSGLQSPRVRMSRGRESLFLRFFKRADETGSLDPMMERVSHQVGAEQQTQIIMDMNSLELALEVATAFAKRWPCLFEYGNTLLNNQQLLENARLTRARGADNNGAIHPNGSQG